MFKFNISVILIIILSIITISYIYLLYYFYQLMGDAGLINKEIKNIKKELEFNHSLCKKTRFSPNESIENLTISCLKCNGEICFESHIHKTKSCINLRYICKDCGYEGEVLIESEN